MNEFESSRRSGSFAVSAEKEIYGELSFNGPETLLYLQDNEPFAPLGRPERCITGVLQDHRKVSLIDCVGPPVPGSGPRGSKRYYFAKVFPHYVVCGRRHITPSEKATTKVHFVIDDASTLFYDFDAFGTVLDARPFIEQISNANALGRTIVTGPDPAILYFTGKREIFAADMPLGKVSASHNPIQNLPGPDGVFLRNKIVVTIEFEEAIVFNEAIARTLTLSRYFGLLVGRPQNLLELRLRLQSSDEDPILLEVYWSMLPKRGPSDDDRRPHPAEVLLDAVHHPTAFSGVLANWLERQPRWQDARARFLSCFAKQHRYDIDRLIAAANMFDILPTTAVPSEVRISKELEEAKEQCRQIFTRLKDKESLERVSLLQALGRIGKSSLKRKIHYRAKPIIEVVGDRFPELIFVINHAVDCRNHYVHGDHESKPKFDYEANRNAVNFLTDTLEFVFAAADLLEAGWDIKAWCQIGSSMAHPFGAYRVNYKDSLKELKALL